MISTSAFILFNLGKRKLLTILSLLNPLPSRKPHAYILYKINLDIIFNTFSSVRNLVTPVVTIDTRNRRNVSDIAWSTLEVDHVAVAFRTQPHVYVYDLKTPLEPLFVFELGKEGGGGNTKIMFMESKFTSLRNGRRYEKLVTGSTSGTLRLWSMNSITYKRVDWEINLDPHTSHPSPVVGLVALHRPDGDGILALSRNGICTIWNSSALSVKTFGSEKTPLCLLRISLWDDIFRPKFGNHINPLPIIGICSLKSNVVYPDNTLGITIGNGDVVIFDIMSQTILSSSFMNAAEYSSRQLTIIGNALIPPSKSSASSSLSLDVPSANASTAYSCNAIFPSWPGAWCCVGRNGTNKLQFIDFLTSLQPPPLHESSKQDTMRKTFQNCFTLPGHIVSIDSTGCKITVSDDLSQYLTTSTMAGSLPSRSCSVCFDWHVAEENASISHYSGVKGIVYTLEDVRNRTLLLSEPYEGPPVSCGNPRVYIKTNLVSVTTPDNPSTNSTTFMQSRVFKSIAASDQVTALAQHSFLPFIVAGLADGTVLIFGQGAGVDD